MSSTTVSSVVVSLSVRVVVVCRMIRR